MTFKLVRGQWAIVSCTVLPAVQYDNNRKQQMTKDEKWRCLDLLSTLLLCSASLRRAT